MPNNPTGCGDSRRQPMVAMLAAALVSLAAVPALALEAGPDETERLKACEKSLCAMILDKEPKGGNLACDVQKTWAKSTLDEGKSQGASWGFGDARCNVDLKLDRKDVIAALTQPKHTIRVPAHDVSCVVDRQGELRPVTARLAPKLRFKDGKADKVWINLESIDGPADVKSTIWTAAKLEDTLGIFHRPMIKQINRFVHRQCERRYGATAQAVAAKAKKAAEAKAKKKAKNAAAAKAKTVEAEGAAKAAPPTKAAATAP